MKITSDKMKMADVRAGMRLVSTVAGALSPITVTELTPRGFKYKLDRPMPFRSDQMFAVDGHEHFGYLGHCDYEPEKNHAVLGSK